MYMIQQLNGDSDDYQEDSDSVVNEENDVDDIDDEEECVTEEDDDDDYIQEINQEMLVGEELLS